MVHPSSGRLYPTGTVRPGSHARDPFTVKISERYILSGSSVFSPIFHATDGAVGVTMTSTFSKAFAKSSRINSRTADAFL